MEPSRRSAGWVRFLLAHRAWVVAAVFTTSLLALYFAGRTGFDNRIEIWFLENDPGLLTYREFLERFEADEVAIVGVFAPDVFAPEVLGSIDRVTRAAAEAAHVHRVRSITNVRIAEGAGDFVSFAPLVPSPYGPSSDADAGALRRRALSHPLIRDTLVSPDGSAAAILVELEEEGNSFAGKLRMINDLKDILERETRPSVRFRLTGTPAIDTAAFESTKRDWKVIGLAGIALVFLSSLLIFRSLSAAAVPLSVVLITLLWTFGLMGALGVQVNMISVSIMALLLAVGVQDSIHVLSDYYRQLELGKSRRDAVESSVALLVQPCAFTSVTTAAGFLSLTWSELRPLREFGWLAAAGVVVAFVVTMTFVPSVLHLMAPPARPRDGRGDEGTMQRVLEWLGRPTRRRSELVVAGSFAILLLSLLLLPRLQVGVNPMSYFHESSLVRRDTEAIDRALSGSTAVQFMVRTQPDGLKEPANLERIEAFQHWVEAQPGITKALSVVDSLKELRRAWMNGDPDEAVVPESRALAAQLYLLLESEEDFAAMIADGYSLGRITAQVRLSESEELTRRIPLLEEQIERVFSDESVRFQATGFVKLMGDMESYLLHSQIRGFVVSFLVVTLTLMLLLRSVRLGLYSLLPNVAPVLAGLAFMAVRGIRLDPGTVMIGGIALGLVVDDSVHYLVRLRARLARGEMLSEAVAKAVHDAGRAILVTSVVLAGGFATLGLGSFEPNVHLGLVSALIVVLALLADLLVLPATMLVVHRNARAIASPAGSTTSEGPAV